MAPTATVADIDFQNHSFPTIGSAMPAPRNPTIMGAYASSTEFRTTPPTNCYPAGVGRRAGGANLSPMAAGCASSMSRSSSGTSIPRVIVVPSPDPLAGGSHQPHHSGNASPHGSSTPRPIAVPPGVLWNMSAPPLDIAVGVSQTDASHTPGSVNAEMIRQLGTQAQEQPGSGLGEDLETLLEQLVAEGAGGAPM
jgi:hypothetical protein